MVTISAKPGPSDSFTDIDGLRVGQAHDAAVRTGVTVILPDAPVAMGVDVRGGGPGTRDTDALDPTCLVDKVHGLVLSGGSVFGLAAADGVAAALSERGIGLPLGPRAVPVVPSAILFDLMNGGDKDWGTEPPYRRLGVQALDAVSVDVTEGAAGAGYGARAGGRAGGIGTASLVTDDGLMVAAIVAVNSFGAVMDGTPEHGTVDLPKLGLVGANTTIGAVATNLTLDKAACTRLAIMAQDGFARAIRPIHTPFDGDTIFAMSTGAKPLDGPLAPVMAVLGTLSADCMVRAIGKAVKAAGVTTGA
ncbi:P1 family peptidase [Kordiimonas marina]|uniref:P1 family peptidase n=1 Tax=Kordiimonas marina TaxID=2872312 RepID=UPI001FF4C363|nr:P1 family peptidase [Kordiimonas marina]MCJ9428223.1 P1 family peptidase [Kordiimonas marina]